jgi:hypothetical protein
MFWVRLVGSIAKTLLIMGAIEYIAPGFSYQVAYKTVKVLMGMWMGGH